MLRLEGDEFCVLLSGSKAERLLEITPRSQLVLYKISPPKVRDPKMSYEDFFRQYAVDAAQEDSDRRIWERRILDVKYFIHQITRVVPCFTGDARPQHFTQISSQQYFTPDEQRGAQSFRVDLRDGGSFALTPSSADAEEFQETIGVHIRRYNRTRLRVVQQLRHAQALRKRKYVKGCAEDEQQLTELWVAVFGDDVPFAPVSDLWNRVGFQSDDPSTDFRGMGLLGLDNLVYFARHFPNDVQRLVRQESAKEYPMATAGINVTNMLMKLLGLDDQLANMEPGSPEWESPLFVFFCYLYDVAQPFHELFCATMLLLDKLFIKMKATYMDFPKVIEEVHRLLSECLSTCPISMQELRAYVESHSGLEVALVVAP
eukprot:TRINITY_DN7074_c0_g1_i1.p1 TRINITY_DN7074_c0_g1~~TRINITY_DN7074_c0_g1_i1.p1  ORF type:complete len:373 (-),score=86.20 TRINITY_DN7074_c0_g1_i1:142-1260(-)